MNRKRHLLLSLTLVLVAAVALRADQIDDYVKSQMQGQHIPALSIAVIKDGALIKAEGYGLADIEHGIPARPDTVFKIGSVSKQFIAAAIMLLVQDGRVAPGDKVSTHLAGTPSTWQEITLRHLLTHTSGLVREAPGFAPYKVQPDIDVIETAYPLPLQSKPGDKYRVLEPRLLCAGGNHPQSQWKTVERFPHRTGVRSAGDDRHPADKRRGHCPEPRRRLRVEDRQVPEHGKLAGGTPKRRVLVDCSRPCEVGGRVAHGPHSDGFIQKGDVDARGTE